MLSTVAENETSSIYYIDPNPSTYLDGFTEVNYIKKKAVEGVKYFVSEVL